MIMIGLIELAFDESGQFANGVDLVFQFQLYAQFVLQIHYHFHGVQRVNAQALKGGIGSDVIYRNVHLLCQILCNFLKHDTFLRFHPPY